MGYPVSKDDLVKYAQRHGAEEGTLQALQAIPDREYDGPRRSQPGDHQDADAQRIYAVRLAGSPAAGLTGGGCGRPGEFVTARKPRVEALA
ncbi:MULTISPECIES: DUF2795 domain-containing protein [unclassified Spirillospora]|uniref:DUF2795 domain-containing protein n=1 Tax=unclassified Spirillospora TaxID=2642701 RepID=UPI003716DBB5